MSVLSCGRRGCDNVMCSRFSERFQTYLCYACFEELVNTGPDTDINAFLNSSKIGD